MIRCLDGAVAYVAGLVAIAITLRVIVRHDGKRPMVKNVSRRVRLIRVFTFFVRSKDEAK